VFSSRKELTYAVQESPSFSRYLYNSGGS
jgi:hypothetical protein